MRGQLKEASSVTSKAFCAFRKELDPDLEGLGQTGDLGAEEVLEETQMSPAITIMKPILRYLQLLCENHNSDLQVLAAIRSRTPSSSVAEIGGGLTSILSIRDLELPALPEQQNKLQPGVRDSPVPGLHLRKHHRRPRPAGPLH